MEQILTLPVQILHFIFASSPPTQEHMEMIFASVITKLTMLQSISCIAFLQLPVIAYGFTLLQQITVAGSSKLKVLSNFHT